MSWQRKARLVIAAGAVVVAAAVALALRSRPPASSAVIVERTDASAVVESAEGHHLRWNRDKEEIRVSWGRQLTYPDGSSRMADITVVTTRAGGRVFTLTGRQGRIQDGEKVIAVEGAVRLEGSDGLLVTTERAEHSESDGVVRAPGPVTFARGRLRATGVGLTYDRQREIITILDRVQAQLDAEAGSSGTALHITAGTAELNRIEHVIRFDRAVTAVRQGQTVTADSALARLSPGEDRVEALELRGNARVTAPPGGGQLQALKGRDIDLKYGPDGETLEKVFVNGDAIMQLKGSDGAQQVAANTLDVALAPDGSTPIAIRARDRVELVIGPASERAATRIIRADTFDATGEAGRGLTSGRFSGDVRFSEKSAAVDRTARSGVLDVKLAAGLGTIDEARFARGVRFDDAETRASAAAARYLVPSGVLELTGSEPGFERPRVLHPDITVTATRLDVTFPPATSGTTKVRNGADRPPATRPSLAGSGKVTSEVGGREPARDRAGHADMAKLPSLLKRDQPVILAGDEFAFDGGRSTATYTGNARLLQGDTSIEANRMVLNEATGDLTASGSVIGTTMLQQVGKDGRKERVRSTARAAELTYEEALRRGTYTGGAHVAGLQGDIRAARIELYLLPSGDELDRVEAYDEVTLVEGGRKTSGSRMTYQGAEERYVVTGAPVRIVDECGREMTGRSATKTADRITVDGNEHSRTRTEGSSKCP
jgi:LPS export ABC transporter protein LptC/lipopolysaccharide transport protein LptA